MKSKMDQSNVQKLDLPPRNRTAEWNSKETGRICYQFHWQTELLPSIMFYNVDTTWQSADVWTWSVYQGFPTDDILYQQEWHSNERAINLYCICLQKIDKPWCDSVAHQDSTSPMVRNETQRNPSTAYQSTLRWLENSYWGIVLLVLFHWRCSLFSCLCFTVRSCLIFKPQKITDDH